MAFKFDLQNPGPKEYVIAGGGAIALVLAWQWWRNRQASQAAAAGQGSTGTGSQQGSVSTSPTGLSLAALLLWLQDHASSSTTTTTTTTATAPSGGKRPTSIIASGKDTGDINQIAQAYGLNEQELIKANPFLRKMKVRGTNGKTIPLIGSGAPVPAGTRLNIPAV